MSILPDHWIREKSQNEQMIDPFMEKQKGQGILSYGLSSYGYDARLSDEFMIFTNVDNAIVDPKNFDENSFVERKTDVCIIPPNSFVLCRTVEYFKIPDDVLVICLGKSTYARCGLIVNVTSVKSPVKPGPNLFFRIGCVNVPDCGQPDRRITVRRISIGALCIIGYFWGYIR